MRQYLDVVRQTYETGNDKSDRTGTGTRGIFGPQMRFNLKAEFPLVKAKFTAFKLVVIELIWLLSGNTNIKFMVDNNCHIWDEWASDSGELGPVYGKQWRNWEKITILNHDDSTTPHADGSQTLYNAKVRVEHIDQVRELINKLKSNPNDRRLIVSAWNVGQLSQMALPACHAFFQFYVNDLSREERFQLWLKRRPANTSFSNSLTKGTQFEELMDVEGIPRQQLSCQLYQRSADLFLGVPFNIASYALLTHLIAHTVGMDVGEFIWTGGDTHIYNNHFSQVEEMLSRPVSGNQASLWLNPDITDIDDFKIDDIRIDNYKHLGVIKAPVAV